MDQITTRVKRLLDREICNFDVAFDIRLRVADIGQICLAAAFLCLMVWEAIFEDIHISHLAADILIGAMVLAGVMRLGLEWRKYPDPLSRAIDSSFVVAAALAGATGILWQDDMARKALGSAMGVVFLAGGIMFCLRDRRDSASVGHDVEV